MMVYPWYISIDLGIHADRRNRIRTANAGGIRRKPRVVRGSDSMASNVVPAGGANDITRVYNDTHNRLMTLLRGFLIW